MTYLSETYPELSKSGSIAYLRRGLYSTFLIRNVQGRLEGIKVYGSRNASPKICAERERVATTKSHSIIQKARHEGLIKDWITSVGVDKTVSEVNRFSVPKDIFDGKPLSLIMPHHLSGSAKSLIKSLANWNTIDKQIESRRKILSELDVKTLRKVGCFWKFITSELKQVGIRVADFHIENILLDELAEAEILNWMNEKEQSIDEAISLGRVCVNVDPEGWKFNDREDTRGLAR